MYARRLLLYNAPVLLRANLPSKQFSISAPQARRLKGEKPNDYLALVCSN
jgi:hypothetical protein